MVAGCPSPEQLEKWGKLHEMLSAGVAAPVARFLMMTFRK